ncbi:hypothetical protein [Nocardia sp. NPDC058705]|uniref:hypothetical protein n=1 Tax=Nocardia sp. NPDC058705 TaxID=3346609 RepID=UPI0036AA7D97
MVAVVHVQVTGIQDFVFRSRTLIDTIGRSHQVEQLTSTAVLDGNPCAGVELVFAGAGRISVRVDNATDDNPELAHQFARWYTRRLAEVSDALSPVVHIDFCSHEDVAQAVVDAPRALLAARHTTAVSIAGEAPWAALRCAVTGAGAEMLDRDRRACAGEVVRSAIEGERFHNEQVRQFLAAVPEPLRAHLTLSREIDQLGRTHGESSQVAVIVADLNGIGRLLKALAAGENPTARLRQASDALRALGPALGTHLVSRIAGSLISDPATGNPVVGGIPETMQFPLARVGPGEHRAWVLPVRPWVLAGDDLVLVCESRIAWWLATAITDWLDADAEPEDPRTVLADLFGQRPTAGVGIAVVPSGYPLVQAHDLAETLCGSAKSRARHRNGRKPIYHAVDWHRGCADPAAVSSNREAWGIDDPRPFAHRADKPDSSLGAFLGTWLGGTESALNGADFSLHRGWCRDTLRRAAASGKSAGESPVQRAVEQLNRARKIAGRSPLALPADPDPGHVLAALELLDEHLTPVQADTTGNAWKGATG